MFAIIVWERSAKIANVVCRSQFSENKLINRVELTRLGERLRNLVEAQPQQQAKHESNKTSWKILSDDFIYVVQIKLEKLLDYFRLTSGQNSCSISYLMQRMS